MSLLRAFSITLVIAGLAGCTAPVKPEMPYAAYSTFASVQTNIKRCSAEGYIPYDLAGWGLTQMGYRLHTWSFNQVQLSEALSYEESRPNIVTKEFCNKMALDIATDRQKVTNNIRAADETIRANQEWLNKTKGTTTYCNRIGNQTFCNSY